MSDLIKMRNPLTHWKVFLPVIGLVLFAYILYKVDPAVVWASIRQMDVKVLYVLPLIGFLIFAIQTIRLKILYAAQDVSIPFWRLFRIQLIGVFYATITPGRVGHMFKIGYIAETVNKSISQCSTSVIVEKFVDSLSLLFFALGGSFLLASRYNLIVYQAVFVILALTSIAIFFHDRGRIMNLMSYISPYIPIGDEIKNKIKVSFGHFYDSMPRKRDVFIPFLLSLVNWGLLYTAVYAVAQSLGVVYPYIPFIFTYSIATIVGVLPITVAGLGTREAALLALFSTSINPPVIISMSIISMMVCGFIPAIIGWFLSFNFKSEINHQPGVGFGYFPDFREKSPLKDAYLRIFGYPYAPRRNEARKSINMLNIKNGEKVLDLGCGDGIFSNSLSRCGYDIYGLDYSLHDVGKARSRADQEDLKIKYSIGDMHKLPFRQGSFDKVLSISVFEHVQDDNMALRQIYDILKNEGELVISVYSNPFYLLTKSFLRFPAKIKKLFFNEVMQAADSPEAYKEVWDKKHNHYRNYTVADAVKKMEKAGFEVVGINYHIKTFGSLVLSFIHSLNLFSWEKTKETTYKFKNEAVFAILFPVFYLCFWLDELLFWQKGVTPIIKGVKKGNVI